MWDFPITLTRDQKQKKEEIEKKIHDIPPAEGTNAKLAEFFFSKLAERRKVNSDAEKDYCMSVSYTHLTLPTKRIV